VKSVSDALINLGYKEFIVRGDTFDGIEWVEQPEVVPTEEQVLAKITELDALEQAEQDAKAAAKESALTKLQALGLSEAEAKQIVGI
jgi:hypothetical protein